MTTNRSRFRFLDPEGDPVAPEVHLRDNFPVLLPPFTPVDSEDPLDDGEPPTKLGQRFRTAFARANSVSEDEVDHGLIRDVEALSADHDHNMRALSQTYQLRNTAGTMVVVRLLVHTPLIGGSVINGRMLSRTGRELRGKASVITEASSHDSLKLPQLDLENAEQPLVISAAQRSVEKLRDYGGDDRDFLDSLALQGILVPPIVAPFSVATPSGSAGWLTQTDDGWRRTTGAKELMSEILTVDADLTYKHWQNADGTLTVRSHTADTVNDTLHRMRFSSSDRAGMLYPPSRAATSVQRWLDDVASRNADVRAFHRLRTTSVEFVLTTHPRDGRTAADVIYLDMAGRHTPGLAAKDWKKPDVEGVVAVRAIDALHDGEYISAAERRVYLGEDDVATKDIASSKPFRNRVVAGTHLLGTLTTDGSTNGRREITRTALKEHGLWSHPDKAATVAAAQAAVVFEADGTADVGSITSTLMSIFKHASIWKDHEHPGETKWLEHVDENMEDLKTAALEESGGSWNPDDHLVGKFGPHQRALMALTGVAHITNGALIDDKESLTRTGRGGRGDVSRKDPIVLLQKMVVDNDGLLRCLAIVDAATGATQVKPEDPITGELMTEVWLREEYLGEDEDKGPDDDPDPLDPESAWWRDLDRVLEEIEDLRAQTDEMGERPVPPELLGLEQDEYEREYPNNPPNMLKQYGVSDDVADKIEAGAEAIKRFVARGAAYFAVRRGQ